VSPEPGVFAMDSRILSFRVSRLAFTWLKAFVETAEDYRSAASCLQRLKNPFQQREYFGVRAERLGLYLKTRVRDSRRQFKREVA
jgi:hypothetical protein